MQLKKAGTDILHGQGQVLSAGPECSVELQLLTY